MLSRKGSSAGMTAAGQSGVDRTRVGERLHAALAGLQELHLLRDRHGDMVSWALRADREEPVTSVRRRGPEDPRLPGAEEQRLEATLTALKQQLSRLRKQDVGLKSHLQQLDQQINELKLDVNKVSTDQQETDSRPSSGFYELSDGGSGSLSNSCTSVYSACMSSPQATLPTSPPSSHADPQNHAEVSRRRSADESTAQHCAPRTKGGLHLGSSRIRANTEKARPRPVSTGDLDRMMGQMQSYNKPVDASKPIANQNVRLSPKDSKFHSNLVSRTGVEVYQYPSPLHAVALQSPIFSPNHEMTNNGFLEGQLPLANSLQRPTDYDSKTLGYIDKILQRSFSKLSFESGTDTLSSQHSHRKPSQVATVFPEVFQKEVSALPPLAPPPPPAPTAPQTTNVVPAQDNDQKRHCPTQEAADNTNQYKQLLRTHEVSHRLSFPADAREYSSDEVTTSTLKRANKFPVQYSSLSRSPLDYRSSDNTEPRHDCKGKRSVPSQSSSTEEGHSFEIPHSSSSPQFVHAQFVPAGSQRVKVRQADRKTKNVKLKKKNVEKPRKHSYSSGEKSKDSSSGKSEPKKSSKGKAMQKSPVYFSDEHRRGSGSDSSHCSPGFMYTQKIQAKPQANAAVGKLGKTHRKPQNMEYEVDQRKKRQGDRQLDVYQAQMSYRQRSREGAVPNMHMVRSASSRAGQWMQQPQRHFPTSMSANSFHQSLNARYPAAPYHVTSSRYPPRCESEYSAECASLFHSTIAASSDGEMSDHTTNRFGDSESSQSYQSLSDSDSSLSFDEEGDFLHGDGGMVWANVSTGPTVAGVPVQQQRQQQQQQQQQPPSRAVPSACRIKASRALKKKIRRFQPASLKVMTLV
ncbi:dapper homolog 2 [Eucyclogobius newberryi]|uniref:dapper homolog 2 n=1 Tax=Eucyclogobius newberryi TaxID=166745 RepID=UPI003B5964C1